MEDCHGILPTADLLNGRHLQIPRDCALCSVHKENMYHLSLECEFAKALRFGSPLAISPDRLIPADAREWLKICLKHGMEFHLELTCPVAVILYTF